MRAEPQVSAAEFVDAVVHADLAGAQRVVDAACAALPIASVYLDLLAPALIETGERWARAEISVAHEHLVSATVEAIAARLAPRLPQAARRGRCCIVGCVDGELHCLGARFVADFLEADGWDTLVLGASTRPRASSTSSRRSSRR